MELQNLQIPPPPQAEEFGSENEKLFLFSSDFGLWKKLLHPMPKFNRIGKEKSLSHCLAMVAVKRWCQNALKIFTAYL